MPSRDACPRCGWNKRLDRKVCEECARYMTCAPNVGLRTVRPEARAQRKEWLEDETGFVTVDRWSPPFLPEDRLSQELRPAVSQLLLFSPPNAEER